MVSSAEDLGRFGNIPKKLIYSVKTMDIEFVRNVHALSEYLYQRALSVKGGKCSPRYKDHGVILDPLLPKEPKKLASPLRKKSKKPIKTINELLDDPKLREVYNFLLAQAKVSPEDGIKWLAQPWNLYAMLKEVQQIVLPTADPRVAAFFLESSEVASSREKSNTDEQ
jgi:hypothetical protein